MAALIPIVKKLYRAEIRVLDVVKDPVLLALRLCFGRLFIVAGWGKLQDVEFQTNSFAGYGIPLPEFNVYLASTTEIVCGALLLIGFASRIVTIPLIVTMLVAYMTAHPDEWAAFWDKTLVFLKAPPFLYLYTAIIVLLFGPGRVSVDALLARYFGDPTPLRSDTHSSTR